MNSINRCWAPCSSFSCHVELVSLCYLNWNTKKNKIYRYSQIRIYRIVKCFLSFFFEGHPEKLPIEAFFYLKGYKDARKKAFKYQDDYLQQTGEKLPVVSLVLPQPDDPELKVEVDPSL